MNNRIIELINFLQISTAEFAQRLQVQRSSISHLTSGRNKPSVDFIEKLINNFPEININWLITGKGNISNLEKPKLMNNLFEEENETNQIQEKKNKAKIVENDFNKIIEEPKKKSKKVKKIILVYEDDTFDFLQN